MTVADGSRKSLEKIYDETSKQRLSKDLAAGLLSVGIWRCYKCNKVQPLENFYIRGNGRPQSLCISCSKIDIRERYAKDPLYQKERYFLRNMESPLKHIWRFLHYKMRYAPFVVDLRLSIECLL